MPHLIGFADALGNPHHSSQGIARFNRLDTHQLGAVSAEGHAGKKGVGNDLESPSANLVGKARGPWVVRFKKEVRTEELVGLPLQGCGGPITEEPNAALRRDCEDHSQTDQVQLPAAQIAPQGFKGKNEDSHAEQTHAVGGGSPRPAIR